MLNVVMKHHVRNENLDLIQGEESTRTSVLSETKSKESIVNGGAAFLFHSVCWLFGNPTALAGCLAGSIDDVTNGMRLCKAERMESPRIFINSVIVVDCFHWDGECGPIRNFESSVSLLYLDSMRVHHLGVHKQSIIHGMETKLTVLGKPTQLNGVILIDSLIVESISLSFCTDCLVHDPPASLSTLAASSRRASIYPRDGLELARSKSRF